MKKLTLITLTMLLINNLVAEEFFLGGGYNFNDKLDNKKDIKLRAEWFSKISFSKSFKFGIGISHNFKNEFEQKDKIQKTQVKGRTPVYAVLKSELETDTDWKIYGKYRIGWNFESKKGLYTGVEIGTEKNNISLGITYDMEKLESRNKAEHLKNNSIGISIGYVFKTENDKDFIMKRGNIFEEGIKEEGSKMKKEDIVNENKTKLEESTTINTTKEDSTRMLKEANKVKTGRNYREWFGFYEDIK